MAIDLTAPDLLWTEPCTEKAPYHLYRVLLALDGSRLTHMLMTEALAMCVQLTDRLDILLANPPKPPTMLLRGLLLRLEHSGIDYRLASSEGDLGQEVQHYIGRHAGITLVLIENVQRLEAAMGARLAGLRAKGYRFLSLVAEPQRSGV